MEKKLTGKVAIVTGASKGIGAEIALQLGRAGAQVVVNYATSKESADRVTGLIQKEGSSAVAIQADLSKPEDIKRLFADAKKAFGRLDILVNNAGIYNFASLEEITPEHFYKMFDLNVLGLLLATQEAAKAMAPNGGSIINVSSIASTLREPGASVYSATKAGVDAITRSLSKELGPKNIRINSIDPGMIETEGTSSLLNDEENDFRKDVMANTPLGRIGQPEDIAPVAVFLASEDSRWITGETIPISGGYT
jgi:3-oxoacyl-[acyl-carrier protein] reductase